MSKTTFNFAQSLVYIRNAKLLLEVAQKDKVNPIIKLMIRGWLKKLDWIIKDFECRISFEANKKLRDDMFNEDSSLQVQNILDMVFDSSQYQRDTIELFITELRKGTVKAEPNY